MDIKSQQQYIDLYLETRQMLAAHSAEVLNAVREEAFEDFCRQGLPTKRSERYKYTDVEEAFRPNYGLNLNRLDIPVNPYDAFRCDVPNMSTLQFFMINDAFFHKAPVTGTLPEGVLIGSLSEAARTHTDLVAPYYSKVAKSADDPIVALNTMLAQDGLFIYLPKGVKLDRTIQVVNILRSDVDLMVNRRVLVVAEEDSEARILLCDHAVDDRPFLTTQVVEVVSGVNSHLEIYELEETHVKNHRFSHMQVLQQAGSHLTHNSLTLHNGQTRNTTLVALQGEGAEANLFGGAILDKTQQADNHTVIDHQAAGCTSNELYKYVLDNQSVGAFAGRILVQPGANQTTSQETNANLLATPEARMFTQPMLEIYADDVKCNHGSTVGQLNEAALFYMRQRGISEAEARMLLQLAFVGEVIETIALEPLKDRLHHLVDKRFRGELSKCEGCKLCK